jgi:hypothetical protein
MVATTETCNRCLFLDGGEAAVSQWASVGSLRVAAVDVRLTPFDRAAAEWLPIWPRAILIGPVTGRYSQFLS